MKNETWKDVAGYEGFYKVSDLGRIKSLDRVIPMKTKNNNPAEYRAKGKIRKTAISNTGYKLVVLAKKGKTKTFSVHRLVALAFCGNPNIELHVNHKNGIKTDNRAVNLEMVTVKENIKHSIDTGLGDFRGENSPNAKLTNEAVLKIRELYTGKWGEQRMLAKMFGVHPNAIKYVLTGKSWSHVK